MSETPLTSTTETALSLKNQGNNASQRGDLAAAETFYKKAIALDANYMPAHYNLGNVFHKTKRYSEALTAFEAAAKIAPDDYEIQVNMGVTLNAMAAYSKAIAAFQRGAVFEPNALEPLINIGISYYRNGQYQQAADAWAKVLERDPSCSIARYYHSLVFLLMGKWEDGFLDHESRLDLANATPIETYLGDSEWSGEPLQDKTLLIYHEQGFGDVIQFLRYTSVCKAAGARVIVHCHEELASLLKTSEDIDLVVAEGSTLTESYDYYISVMSLPYALGRHPELSPLHLDVASKLVPEITNATGLKVGICWQGGAKHDRDAERSIPLETISDALSELTDTTFFSLQDKDLDAGSFATSLHVHINNFADTAALAQQMDVVVTVDTAVAHLCGSLGIPTYLLITYAPDWRWGIKGDTTPWYPSMKLFRQPALGDWQSALAKVRQSLEDLQTNS
jgi:tetratricopeptide (TPR) repeat protein